MNRFGNYGSPGAIYTGILMLATGEPLDNTLRSITDQVGTVSPLQLSTTLVAITSSLSVGGTFTNAARVHIRGDGTNPILRLDDGTGVSQLNMTNSGQISFANQIQGPLLRASVSLACSVFTNQSYNGTSWLTVDDTFSTLSFLTKSINLSIGATNPKMFSYAYTINNSGAQTGTATGIFVNAIETALNGMTHNLMNLQRNSTSVFSVSNTGAATMATGSFCPDMSINSLRTLSVYFGSSYGFILPTAQGVFKLSDATDASFNRLQFGGITNLFPSQKRNGAEFQFRLADDSAFTRIAVGTAQVAAKVGGTIFDYYTDVTVGGAETDIYSTTLLANTYNANADKVISTYGGNFVTVGTELTQLKAYLGGTLLWDSTAMAVATGTTTWRIRIETIRVSATVVRYTVSLNTTGAAGYVYAKSGELTGLTLSQTNIVKITGASSGAGSGVGNIVGKMGIVEWHPAA